MNAKKLILADGIIDNAEAVKKLSGAILTVDNQIRDNILMEIAKSYSYSISDIRTAYDLVQSFDTTIRMCEVATDLGMNNPLYILDLEKSSLLNAIPVPLSPKVINER